MFMWAKINKHSFTPNTKILHQIKSYVHFHFIKSSGFVCLHSGGAQISVVDILEDLNQELEYPLFKRLLVQPKTNILNYKHYESI